MGQDISFPLSTIPDSTTIYTKTQPTIDIMNKVLDFILKNADYRDMIALVNEKECAKWIIISESKLNQLFQRIKVQPERGKDGILYLKKIDTLKQNNDILGCKLLAIFFVRLFQVVGALSLSIMDTKIPDRGDYLVSSQPVSTERKGVPFFKPLEERKKFLGLFGGELEDKDLTTINTTLHIFRKYLTKMSDNTYALTTIKTAREQARNVPGYVITINDNSLVFVSNLGSSSLIFKLTEQNSELYIDVIQRNGKDYPYSQSFNYAPQSNESIQVVFNKERSDSIDFVLFITTLRAKILELPPSQTIKILSELNYLEPTRIQPYYRKIKNIQFDAENENAGIFVKENDYKSESPRFVFGYAITTKENKTVNLLVSFNLSITKINTTYTVEISNARNESSSKQLEEFTPNFDFESYEEKSETDLQTTEKTIRKFTIKSGISSFISEPTNRTQTIPKYLESMFKIIKTQALSNLEMGPMKSKQGYLNPMDDSSVTNSRLKSRELWINLTRSPPIKSFCTARALQLLNISGLQKNLPETIRPLIYNTSFDLVKDGSLPTPGQSITSAIGIKALSALYENFSDIYDGTQKDASKNIPLGKVVLTSFIENEELRANIQKLEEIKESSGTQVSSFESKTNKAKVDALRTQARLLFQTQFDHTSKVNALLQKIFVFSEPITLNSRILEKGLKGIEEIAVEARDLLTEYYSKCQIEYTKGVKILVAPQQQQSKLNTKN